MPIIERGRHENEILFATGASKAVVEALIGASLVRRNAGQLGRAARSWRRVLDDGRLGYLRKGKYVCFNGRVFLDCFAPAWPGKPFDRLADHMVRIVAGDAPASMGVIPSLVISITKKCVYRCEHCYAIETLGGRDAVTKEAILRAVRQMQARGLAVVAWEGGEPLLRFDELLSLIVETHEESEAWIATTGWGLTDEKARRLREAGLSGAIISLDHWVPDKHNAFRRNRRAFDAAVDGVRTFRENGVLPAICICATRESIADDSLYRYLELARSIGVGFVQVLDATPAGNYLGQNVMLTKPELAKLRAFHVEANTSPEWADHPAVSVRSLIEGDEHFGCCACNGLCYVDSSGNLQACDLLQIGFGNVYEEGFDPVYARMREHFPAFSRGRCPAQSLHKEIERAHARCGTLPIPHSEAGPVLEKIRRRRPV